MWLFYQRFSFEFAISRCFHSLLPKSHHPRNTYTHTLWFLQTEYKLLTRMKMKKFEKFFSLPFSVLLSVLFWNVRIDYNGDIRLPSRTNACANVCVCDGNADEHHRVFFFLMRWHELYFQIASMAAHKTHSFSLSLAHTHIIELNFIRILHCNDRYLCELIWIKSVFVLNHIVDDG